MIEQSPLGVCINNLDGSFVSANPADETLTGYTEEELKKLTLFEITHPDDRTEAAPLPDQRPKIQSEGSHETILLVEDETSILEITTRMLKQKGYTLIAAGTPGEAMELAHTYTGEIHLLITDVVMPEMNGRDLAKNICSHYPNLKCLFMSGYTANVIAHNGVL